ncbi:hypothetical protein [Falsihalocynthiibacter arcticus]|uniref:Uncharacterized protein n=1 Tax=Falsihalocynthiibacter arcticus TaxID=1579316 RepID=A0A126V3Z9_9RHOB|nr:hypothetical protein [Falsihalocynthiibacter arcticus]AML53013.1 hypothetical protein RC74_18685 [Falsihalocynthiibacter arcticus]
MLLFLRGEQLEFGWPQPNSTDGGQVIGLKLNDFDQTKVAAFSINVDDTAGASKITVSDSEIEGVQFSTELAVQSFKARLRHPKDSS